MEIKERSILTTSGSNKNLIVYAWPKYPIHGFASSKQISIKLSLRASNES